jgi:site-specific DNA recombinase
MKRSRDAQADRAAVRCAIYTRKSSEEGLEQEFNSLDAQRESGEAYIKSQAHEGLECLATHYDDGGFTGGNMERPALKRLLTEHGTARAQCPAFVRAVRARDHQRADT